MPMVDGKKYPYTKEGKEAAEKARDRRMHGGKVRADIFAMEKICASKAGKNNSVTY